MTTFAVVAKDERNDQLFVLGPFLTKKSAYDWAWSDATEKATEWDMKDGLSYDYEESLAIEDGNNELVYSWDVKEITYVT